MSRSMTVTGTSCRKIGRRTNPLATWTLAALNPPFVRYLSKHAHGDTAFFLVLPLHPKTYAVQRMDSPGD